MSTTPAAVVLEPAAAEFAAATRFASTANQP